MERLKTVGLILAGLAFLIFEVAFFSAAITVTCVLFWFLGIALGWFESGNFQINWWVAASLVVILLKGVKSQFKESYKTLDEIKFIWSKQ